MDAVLGTFVLSVAAVGVIGVFIFGSLHILRCTENAQERFSWASVGRSIRWVFKCVSGR